MAGESEKRTPGGTKRLKKLFEQSKMRSRAWLQDRSTSDLQSRYAAATKSGNFGSKQIQGEVTAKSFGRRLDSNYFFANEVLGRPSCRLRGKN